MQPVNDLSPTCTPVPASGFAYALLVFPMPYSSLAMYVCCDGDIAERLEQDLLVGMDERGWMPW